MILNLSFPWRELLALAWLGILLYASRGLGRTLLALVMGRATGSDGRGCPADALSTALGVGVLAQIFFWAGLLGEFSLPLVLVAAAGGCLLGLRHRAGGSERQSPPAGTVHPTGNRRVWPAFPGEGWRRPGLEAFLGLLALILVLIPLILSLVPETGFDALRTHLWMTRELARTGRMPADSTNWNVFIPNCAVPWFSALYLLAGETGAKLGHWALGVLAASLLINFGRRHVSGVFGLIAGIFFLALPVVGWEMGSAYVDLAVTLFSLATLLTLAEWLEKGGDGWLFLSGVFLGFAFSAKYHGLIWAPFWLVAVGLGARHFGFTPRRVARLAAASLGLAVLVSLPWLVRNLVITGNPFFPVPVPGFHSTLITPEIVASIREEQASFGSGRTIPALLGLPLNLLLHPERFRGSPGPLVFLALLPILLWRRPFSRLDRFMAAASVYWLAAWFFISQEIRYLLPALPLLAWVAVRPLFPAAGEKRLNWFRAGWGCLLLVQFIGQLPPVYARLFPGVPMQVRLGENEWRTVTGRLSREEYLARTSPFFPVYRWAGDHLAAPVRILSFDACAYWSRWPLLYAFSVEGDFTGKEHDPARVLVQCRQRGLTHVVVNSDWVTPEVDLAKAPVFFDPAFQNRHLQLVHRQGPVLLFRILW